MQKFTVLFIFILSGCGSSVVSMSRGEMREADSGVTAADSSSAQETSVTEPDVQVVAQDVPVVAQDANVENDSGTIVVDASVEPDVVIAEEDVALAEDVAVVDAAPETGADVVMEAETDASIGDAGVDAGLECHPDPRYAAPVTIAWGDGSERPNLFYLTIEVPAGWVPVTLQINLPIRQNNGTFIPATARFDVRDSGLRCAVLMGQRVTIRVPMDFGDRPENGRYVNWVLRATSASHPDTVEDFTLDRPIGITSRYTVTRSSFGTNNIGTSNVLVVEADGNYARALQLSTHEPMPEREFDYFLFARSPWVVESDYVREVSYEPVFPLIPHVGDGAPSIFYSWAILEVAELFRHGVEMVSITGYRFSYALWRPVLRTFRFNVQSSIDGSRGMRSAAAYNASTGRCEDLGLVQIATVGSSAVLVPFEFIPITVPPATTPECFIHILGFVCPPGRPLLADGRCGPPRTS